MYFCYRYDFEAKRYEPVPESVALKAAVPRSEAWTFESVPDRPAKSQYVFIWVLDPFAHLWEEGA